MEVLRAYLLSQFEQRMIDRIASKFPQQFTEMGRDGAAALVKQALQRAEDLDLTAEEDVRALLDLMVRTGSEFEQWLKQKGPREILTDDSLPAEVRMRLLHMEITGVFPEP